MRPGLGVDDMFALVTALENLSEEEARLPIDQRMGLVRTSILILYNGGIETFLSPGDEARWHGNHHHHRHRPRHLCHWQLHHQILTCQVALRQIIFPCCKIISFREYCQFAIPSLSIVYLFMCTFFLAVLAIDQKRIDAGR